MSNFQERTLEVDEAQNREEDEDLEDQQRRNEELEALLATGIPAFNDGDTTINSSLTSMEGAAVNQSIHSNKSKFKYEDSSKTLQDNLFGDSEIDLHFKNANKNEQLQVLYEVRVREIKNLTDEFNRYKSEKNEEINFIKKKAILAEAEARRLQVTLTNSDSLLVEKTNIINTLQKVVTAKDQELDKLKKIIEEQNLEICTYKSTNNELHLKLANTNSFSVGARKLNGEELQRAHQDKIVKLETLLQEQTKKTQILEKDKSQLQEDLTKLLKSKNDIEEENNKTILGLTKKLQSAHQECQQLFVLGDAIKKESDHFKERIRNLEANIPEVLNDSFKAKKMDKETLIMQLEKLRKMLLDRNIELDTLKAKLQLYESDMNELFHYRRILNNMYGGEIHACSNDEHEELIIFMQGQLQSCQQAIDDRNTQIMNLNLVNKELQEKIEEMIQQTRTDIRNLSEKYSLPQLETMSNELKNAEQTINELQQQMNERNETIQLTQKEFEIRSRENVCLKDEKRALEDEIAKLKLQLHEFKRAESQLTEENERVKEQMGKLCSKLGLTETDIIESNGEIHEMNSLKSKYGRVHEQLNQVVAHLEEMNQKRANFNIILKMKKQIENYLNAPDTGNREIDEKLEQWHNLLCDFVESFTQGSTLMKVDVKELEMRENIEELTNAKTLLEGEKLALEFQLKSRTDELDVAKKEIARLHEESENNVRAVKKLNDQVSNLNKCLKIVEANKAEVEKQLENTQKQLNEAKQETIHLHKEVAEAGENVLRRSLFQDLKTAEQGLGSGENHGDVLNSDIFQKCLQAQVLKTEIMLRDQLQEENIRKLQRIEEQYRNVIMQRNEMYNKEKEKRKEQEATYRKQFAAILDECGKKVEELENDNLLLVKAINNVADEYKRHKSVALSNEQKYVKSVNQYKSSFEVVTKQWSRLLEYYMYNATKIEKRGKKEIKNVIKKINRNQTEVKLIEKLYEEKIKKYQSEMEKNPIKKY